MDGEYEARVKARERRVIDGPAAGRIGGWLGVVVTAASACSPNRLASQSPAALLPIRQRGLDGPYETPPPSTPSSSPVVRIHNAYKFRRKGVLSLLSPAYAR